MRKIIIAFCVLSFLFCCESNNKGEIKKFKYKKGALVEYFIDINIKDTIDVNKKQDIKILFHHSLDSLDINEEDYKLVDACLIFTDEKKLSEIREKFISECDTTYAPRTRVNDTVLFSFNFTSKTPGKKYLLIKIDEKNYLKTHEDSTRLVSFEYFYETEFIVK